MTTLVLALTLAFASPPSPTCVLPDHTQVRLEVAITDEERAMGLMFRDVVPPDTGMLFLFATHDIWPFWMKDTMVSLDFMWLDAQGLVVEVQSHIPPCRADPCPSYAPKAKGQAVLEMVAGSAQRHGIKPGVKLVFTGVPGYPVVPVK